MKAQKSKLLYNLGNNLITIGQWKVKEEALNTHENWFVAEVMNEITHLPYDSFLIPFLRKLNTNTNSSKPDDIINIENWSLGYLDPDENKSHQERLSVQTDATIVLKDAIIIFEFKKPHKVASQNSFDINQIGRQILLATKLSIDYSIPKWKSIIVCNTAPNLHIKNIGLLPPEKVANMYFSKNNDMLNNPIVKNLLPKVMKVNKDNYYVLTWTEFIDKIIEVLNDIISTCDSLGLKRLCENAKESIFYFLERRKYLFETVARV